VSPELQDEIGLEFSQLRSLLDTFSPLLLKVAITPPEAIEIAALAGMLHSFYNGVENILKRIAVHSGENLPASISWHSELLESMAAPGSGRPAVISRDLLERLRSYLGFRHVYRHSYTFQLQWPKMEALVAGVGKTLKDLEASMKILPIN
jgi:hypothetical protein